MKKIILYIASITGIMFFVSCEKTLSTVNDLNLKHEPMLAISFSNDTSDYTAGSISQTKNVTGTNNQIDFIDNAKGYLYEDGVLVDSLSYDNFQERYRSSKKDFAPNKTYKLVVEHPSFKSTEATDIMPTQITPQYNFILGSKTFYIPDYQENKMCDQIDITFNDDVNTTDYYAIQIYGNDTAFGMDEPFELQVLCFDNDFENEFSDNNNDPTSNESLVYGKLIWKDQNFNGGSKKISLYVPQFFSGNMQLYCVVTHMSENYYRYLTTFNKYLNSEGNPFAEPVQVYSNTKNGAGIFALKKESRTKVN